MLMVIGDGATKMMDVLLVVASPNADCMMTTGGASENAH